MVRILSVECGAETPRCVSAGGRESRPPACGSGCGLVGFFAALGVGLALLHDPGMCKVEQFGHRQQVVEAETVSLLPGIVLLVTARWDDRIPVAVVAVISPDRHLQ